MGAVILFLGLGLVYLVTRRTSTPEHALWLRTKELLLRIVDREPRLAPARPMIERLERPRLAPPLRNAPAMPSLPSGPEGAISAGERAELLGAVEFFAARMDLESLSAMSTTAPVALRQWINDLISLRTAQGGRGVEVGSSASRFGTDLGTLLRWL